MFVISACVVLKNEHALCEDQSLGVQESLFGWLIWKSFVLPSFLLLTLQEAAPGGVLLFPALTDRKHSFLASFRTDFSGRRAFMFLTEPSCVPPAALRSEHTVTGAPGGSRSCGAALVHCAGSCTAWLSGLL